MADRDAKRKAVEKARGDRTGGERREKRAKMKGKKDV